jgi:hypothetical protein
MIFPSHMMPQRRPGVLGRSGQQQRDRPIDGDYRLGQHRHELRLRAEDSGDLVRQLFVIGVDLGAMVDPAAMAVVRTRIYDERFMGPRDPHVDVIWLQRWPTGDPDFYLDIKNDVAALAVGLQNTGDVSVVPDGSGVSWCAELRLLLQQMGFHGRVSPITSITSNANPMMHTDRKGRQRRTVPKLELVNILNLYQQARIASPCRNCDFPVGLRDWKIKDLAKVWKGEREGETGTVVYVGSDGVGVQFSDGEGLEYDAAELTRVSGQHAFGCTACRKLRFRYEGDDEYEQRYFKGEYQHFMAELKSFQDIRKGGVDAVNTHLEHRGTAGGVRHHGDLTMACANALYDVGIGNRRLVMHVGGK